MTLYWLTNTAISAARLYWDNKRDFFDAKDISIPFAISVFPDELYQAPRSWAERAYPITSSITTRSSEAATSPLVARFQPASRLRPDRVSQDAGSWRLTS